MRLDIGETVIIREGPDVGRVGVLLKKETQHIVAEGDIVARRTWWLVQFGEKSMWYAPQDLRMISEHVES